MFEALKTYLVVALVSYTIPGIFPLVLVFHQSCESAKSSSLNLILLLIKNNEIEV